MDIKSKIKEEDITNLAQKLIRIPSDEIAGEQEVCEYLSDILKSLGMKVRLQEVLPKRPNIIAEVFGGNNGKSIMFNGHIDTVPIGNIEKWNTDPYKAIIKDNKLFGRGATEEVGYECRKLGIKKVLIITDQRVADLPVLQTILNSLETEK